ncbi:uncharacterized protein LOC144546079 [Carex rostrata]
MPWISPKFSSIHIKLTRSSAMSNLFRFIVSLALALAAADYFFSVFAALIDLFPSLPTLPSSYIYISSLLVVCAYKLFSALPKLFNDGLGGLFFSVFAENISSRIISWIIDHFPSSRGQMNGVRLNSHQSSKGQMNTGQNLVVQMLIAKDLQIKHVDGLNPGEKNKYWKCVSLRESRFVEALEALQVWVLRVEAKIKLDQLSPETNYAAHLIFKTKPNSKGLHEYQRALIYSDGYRWEKNVCISPGVVRPGNKCNVYPVKRSDGWMEIELGQFYCDGDASEVGVCLEEANTNNKKTGLIISGIEAQSTVTVVVSVNDCLSSVSYVQGQSTTKDNKTNVSPTSKLDR